MAFDCNEKNRMERLLTFFGRLELGPIVLIFTLALHNLCALYAKHDNIYNMEYVLLFKFSV